MQTAGDEELQVMEKFQRPNARWAK